VNQDGADLCVDDPRYSGDAGPEPGAALRGGGLSSILGSTPTGGATSQDGNAWRRFGAD